MAPASEKFQIEIVSGDVGAQEQNIDRLDRWLAGHLARMPNTPSLSRSRLKCLILEGRVSCEDRTITDPSRAVKPGQTYRLDIPPPEPAEPEAEEIPLSVVYEDDDLVVIDKQAGLVVHPAPGSWDGTLVNALLAHFGDRLSGIGGVRRPGIVHRIDKDTSGLMVIAKSDDAHQGLVVQFAAHTIERRYHAVLRGVPTKVSDRIEGPIGRSQGNRKKMAVTATGKRAVTHYRLLERFGMSAALVECRLETGRTHQIRVHMATMGHALIGDPLYGRSNRASDPDPIKTFNRQALHAAVLGFEHPISHEKLRFESSLPIDMEQFLTRLRDNFD